ncbi:hypothetical protein [Bacillus niameyensis]|uniref:hypothetical protein n=1 Tax=Bacillus niameyensis TaxID=1522308 RepID=UPI0007803C31|nr:hypothetical protein [Bacillus niameyensis]
MERLVRIEILLPAIALVFHPRQLFQWEKAEAVTQQMKGVALKIPMDKAQSFITLQSYKQGQVL